MPNETRFTDKSRQKGRHKLPQICHVLPRFATFCHVLPRVPSLRSARHVAGAFFLTLGLLVGSVGPASADREWSWTLDKDKNPLGAPLPYLYDFEIDGLYKPSG